MTCPKYPKIDTLYTRDEKFKVTDEIRRPEFFVPREWLVTEKIHGCNIRVSLESSRPCIDELQCNATINPSEFACTCSEQWVMRINGRNDNSQIPPNLLKHLQDTFTLDRLKSLWRCKNNCTVCRGVGWLPIINPDDLKADGGTLRCPNVEPYPITLYGKGYGGGIQKGGGAYTSKTKGGAVSFRLFDVLVGETWLRRADVEDVAAKLSIKCVPLILPPKSIAFRSDLSTTRITFGDVTVAYGEKPWDLELITEYVRDGIQSIVAYEEGTEGHLAEGIVAFTAEPLYNNRGQRLMFKLKVSDFE